MNDEQMGGWVCRPWTPPEERDAARWKRSGMTYAEIASVLDRTPGAVQAKLSELPDYAPESPPSPRPAWSYPDRYLVKVCHEARDEIRRALKR